ncbi:MAG: LacI family DNA-binding transcriptional regulator [Mesorhizobium sp.]|nr:LacI family DNA-binding transcriptional regulator [Mesorhizobium sp.]MBL8579106.1 LacI family DNA-binding transcriptional regulator [Mesorhizobium sp.]
MNSHRTKLQSRRPSLQDVANMAGVSAAAVSYVVNGRMSEVSAETGERIKTAIAALNYQPQRRGLSLRLSREFAVGFVILDATPSFLADPFTTNTATGLCNAFVEPGYGVTLTGCRTLDDLRALRNRPVGVDAYVVMTSGPPQMRAEAYRLLAGAQLPLVVIQEPAPSDIDDACAVMQDDFGGAQMLTKHVVDRGAKRLMWIGPTRDWPAVERREAGLRSALPLDAQLQHVACNEEDFVATTDAIAAALDTNPLPQAILGANDQIAIAALKVLARNNVSVPDQIQVTGYNDFAFRNYSTPLLTTVTSSAYQLGQRAAQMILSRLEEGQFQERKVELSVKLNVGDTTLT